MESPTVQKIKIQNGQIKSIQSKNSLKSPKNLLKDIFLPTGYPDSVSNDYLTYQIYDTLQALCSSLSGSLATFAVLKTVGVGNNQANLLSSTLSWLLKDGSGMISSILFTYFNSNYLDIHSKQWRLVADIFNDIAILIDILSKSPFILCFSSIFRSIVGVAGGATRMQITLHQASKRNGENIGDINAKDGAQETFVNLLGLILNLFLVPKITSNDFLMYSVFTILTILHIYFNFQAVKSVKSKVLNVYRLNFILENKIFDVNTVNEQEPIFTCLWPYFTQRNKIFRIKFCSSLSKFNRARREDLKLIQQHQNYLITSHHKNGQILVNFKNNFEINSEIILKIVLNICLGYKNEKVEEYYEKLIENGWDVTKHMFYVGQTRIDF